MIKTSILIVFLFFVGNVFAMDTANTKSAILDEFKKKLLEEARREYDLKRTICLVSDEKQNSLVCDLINYPHAFVLAAIMDRQITFERAWAIPYLIKEKLGDFSLNTL